MLQEAPRSGITGTVVVFYGDCVRCDLLNFRSFLFEYYDYEHKVVKEIDTDNTDLLGFYLDPWLYEPDKIEQVNQTLWVLEDNLGNLDIDDWSNRHEIHYVDGIGNIKVHEAYQSHENVTLRALVIERI